MPRIKHPRISRRVPPLKDSDFDHEINLVNNDDHNQASGSSSSLGGPSSLTSDGSRGRSASRQQDVPGPEGSMPRAAPPAVMIRQPTTPYPEPSSQTQTQPARESSRPRTAESEIDLLYENQRGGFLCGIPLFSPKALGNLDPSPWTNAKGRRASPTDIKTAQVPDPSWEWAWPEWRIQHGDKTDEEGWAYSFAFYHKFSWHKPRWWNSFVRRRIWARKRVKKNRGYQGAAENPMMLNPEYFTVRPSAELARERSPSRASSRAASRMSAARMSVASRLSVSTVNSEGLVAQPVVIETVDEMLDALRAARIDRERIEAVENFLANAREGLAGLQDHMHEMMALFVFQASRKTLLAKLHEVYNRAVEERDKRKGHEEASPELERRVEHLAAAIKHADEEVKRLEFWSDVKSVAEAGTSMRIVDPPQGWKPGGKGGGECPAAPSTGQEEDGKTDKKKDGGVEGEGEVKP